LTEINFRVLCHQRNLGHIPPEAGRIRVNQAWFELFEKKRNKHRMVQGM
jgi:hypothetical protein